MSGAAGAAGGVRPVFDQFQARFRDDRALVKIFA